MLENSSKNKTVIITGSNKGIGKAILEELSNEGFDCFACTRNIDEEFKLFCKSLENKNKNKINIISLSLDNNEEILESVKKIFLITKKIDALVNCAGTLFNSLFQMTSQSQLQNLFQINFFSQVYLTQLISREMVKNKKGNILFISSTSADGNDYGRFAYSSSKAAISSTVRVLANELAQFNIRVNSICPGLTDTDLMRKNTKANMLDKEIDKISLKRIANPKEISSVASFLLSEKSSYITGQNLIVDGGRP